MKLRGSIVFAAGAAILWTAVANAAPSKAPSFAAEIAPIFRSRCAACHLTGKEAGNLALHPATARISLVGKRSTAAPHMLVTPGQPQASYLLMKLDGTHIMNGGKGARMPFGSPPLDTRIIGIIREWIAAGAPDN